ncbi:MAG TPA: glycosyltransferase [Chitinophagaceae bacterium]
MNPAFEENYLPGRQEGLRKIRILVAPLDWGLGHATRCIPVIYGLLKQECEVWIAAEDPQKALLEQEFPELNFLPLPGYRIRYGRSAVGMLWSMFSQAGKIRHAIRQENIWLKRMVDEHRFDAVISDNRYGLYHSSVPCIFITHQLTIKSPLGKWNERLLQKWNYKYINRFSACWVPDEEGENNLGGELSHPLKKPGIPFHYIGSLSRFEKIKTEEKKDHIVVILSGPEPQRSILEEKIIRDIAHYPGSAVIVRGLPSSANIIPSANSILFYNHLSAEELNKEMARAEYIISRSGYSTIMDLVKLRKKSILIPTPGQTEQEYLGRYLFQKQLAFCISQQNFSLNSALQQAKNFVYHLPDLSTGDKLHSIINQFIASVR